MLRELGGQSTLSAQHLLSGHSVKYASRAQKATKLTRALEDYAGHALSPYLCLDVGCASGAVSRYLAEQFRQVVGIDVDGVLLAQARFEITAKLTFAQADGSCIPFADGQFDVVVCAQVYEHASDSEGLAREIWRVLRPGGICFFSGPNKLAIVEEHYWLPFLSWLPKPIADSYMRLVGRGSQYDVNPCSYWELLRLWGDFKVYDYTLPMLREPERFEISDELGRLAWIGRLPSWILRLLLPVAPNFNWILVK